MPRSNPLEARSFVSACNGLAAEAFDFPSMRAVVGLLSLDVFSLPSLENSLHVRFVNIESLDWVEDVVVADDNGAEAVHVQLRLRHKECIQQPFDAPLSTADAIERVVEQSTISIPRPVQREEEACLLRFTELVNKRFEAARDAALAHLSQARAAVERQHHLGVASSSKPWAAGGVSPAMSGVEYVLAAPPNYSYYLESSTQANDAAADVSISRFEPQQSTQVDASVGDFLWGGADSAHPSISVSRVNMSIEVSTGGYEAHGEYSGAGTASAVWGPQDLDRHHHHPASSQSLSEQSMALSPPGLTSPLMPQLTSHSSAASEQRRESSSQQQEPRSCPSSTIEIPNLQATCAPQSSEALVDYLRFRAEKDRRVVSEALLRLRLSEDSQCTNGTQPERSHPEQHRRPSSGRDGIPSDNRCAPTVTVDAPTSILNSSGTSAAPPTSLVEDTVAAPPDREAVGPADKLVPSASDTNQALSSLIDEELASRTSFWQSRGGQGLLTLLAADTARITAVDLHSVDAECSGSAGAATPHLDLVTGDWTSEYYEYDHANERVRIFLHDSTNLNAFLHALVHNRHVGSLSFFSLTSITDEFVQRLCEIEMEKAEQSAVHTLTFRNCLKMTDNAAGAILNWLRFAREESTVHLKGVLRHVVLRGPVSPWSRSMYDAVMKEAQSAANLYAAGGTVIRSVHY